MSELSFEGQESKTVPYCHDCPPQYDLCQPSQDVLTFVIENEHICRILVDRLDNMGTEFFNLAEKNPAETDYLLLTELLLEAGEVFTEGIQISAELANVYKERTVQTTELYTAMSRLSVSEFKRTYASLKRDQNRQMRHELAQDNKDRGDSYDTGCGDNSQRSLGVKQIEGAGD
ncbi:hypothetical protein N7448_008194 [Penicillium atrosanguineum]|uniref:Uncharacterized protein n=1 Tax=Penicillium atrosanguineum TaxID=1132637 RepID=A0A9W9QEY1_9EURO|nr:flavoprotein-like protein [Penicillium atrosanguineum]KAJ5127415.1 hypothetical protein N7448_008194 [Penicillium atrosanguineum]KAJ5147618.1 hypothetical protein N7526_000970 [Penicillium atrosanguineum]KAJ5313907.1 flavoprotein-like protein [Penicillium atrosanguineum]KAJ5331078.1 hypothetical protein N7476_000861 [Penicillium atrosanguineum]